MFGSTPENLGIPLSMTDRKTSANKKFRAMQLVNLADLLGISLTLAGKIDGWIMDVFGTDKGGRWLETEGLAKVTRHLSEQRESQADEEN